MSKIIKNIIETCYKCPYQYDGKCYFDNKHRPIEVKEKWFPDWCPLEDYTKKDTITEL